MVTEVHEGEKCKYEDGSWKEASKGGREGGKLGNMYFLPSLFSFGRMNAVL